MTATLTEGSRRAQQGMTRASNKAHPDFKTGVYYAIQELAHTRAEFCADDVFEILPKYCAQTIINTTNWSASGMAFRIAAKQGLIQKTGRLQPSRRPVAQAKELPVWRSLLTPKKGAQ